MVVSEQNADGTEVRITARGNFSLGPGGLLNLLAALGAVTLLLAGLLAWQGFWPVLAIAIVQIVLVSWILVAAWHRSWAVDTIEVGPERIVVTQHRHKQKYKTELETVWAVPELKRPEVAWYSPRLTLRAGTQEMELGKFLTTEEKRQLAESLQRAIRKYSAMPGALKL